MSRIFENTNAAVLAVVALALAMFALLAPFAHSQVSDSVASFDSTGGTTGASDAISIEIKIESKDLMLSGERRDTIEVTINSHGSSIAAFDFTFAYDSRAVRIVEAIPGEFLDQCDWEYFQARYDPLCEGPCPEGLLKIVALSEFRRWGRENVCYQPDSGSSIVKIIVEGTGDYSGIEESFDLRFFWIDCGDNSVSSLTGDDLFVSLSVTDLDTVFNSETDSHDFPNYSGATAKCWNPSKPNAPTRAVNYYNARFAVVRTRVETAPLDSATTVTDDSN